MKNPSRGPENIQELEEDLSNRINRPRVIGNIATIKKILANTVLSDNSKLLLIRSYCNSIIATSDDLQVNTQPSFNWVDSL